MGIYIEGLEAPKTGSIRIQLYDDGTVWAFQGFGWERQEKKYTDFDLVRCGECKWGNKDNEGTLWCEHAIGGIMKPTDFCSYGERRTDPNNCKGCKLTNECDHHICIKAIRERRADEHTD